MLIKFKLDSIIKLNILFFSSQISFDESKILLALRLVYLVHEGSTSIVICPTSFKNQQSIFFYIIRWFGCINQSSISRSIKLLVLHFFSSNEKNVIHELNYERRQLQPLVKSNEM